MGAGDDAFAVGEENHAADAARVPLQSQDFLTGGRVPDLRRLVRTGAGDKPAVGTKGQTRDRSGVPPEGSNVLARGGVPDLHAVANGADDLLAVLADEHAAYAEAL